MNRLRWLLALTLCSCSPLKAAFECRANDQCVDGVAGVCEPTGFCSFPDGNCGSGRRYGELAGSGLGGRCVEAGGDGGVVQYDGCAQSLAGGGAHVCAVIAGGGVQCWGLGAKGQLGSGSFADQPLPQAVLDSRAMPLSAASLALGAAHSCAISASGTIACWGDNARGQLGTGAAPSPQPVPALLGINPVAEVAAGGAHTCAAVGPADLVWCWGANDDGQLSSGGGDAAMPQPALARDGTQLSGVAALAAGRAHSCALSSDHLSCWGRNVEGQLGSGNSAPSTAPVEVAGLGRVTAVSAGGDRACAVVDGNAVWCWGAGQPVAMQVLAATVVAVGAVHACAIAAGGGVACWGDNSHGQLGDGSNQRRDQPVAVLDGDGNPLVAAEVVVGDGYSCARTAGGGVLCWGQGALLGDGTSGDRPRAGVARLTCP